MMLFVCGTAKYFYHGFFATTKRHEKMLTQVGHIVEADVGGVG